MKQDPKHAIAHKRIATMTADESQVYSDSFEYFLNNVRNNSRQADRFAWNEACRQFPRLKSFDGAKP